MIFGYTGTPGSGKSYEAVLVIMQYLMKGKTVYSNIAGLNDRKCREAMKVMCGLSDLAIERQLKFLEKEQIEDFWNHVSPKSLIVIDEVQKFFSSRDWQSDKNKLFGSWASTHRHNGYDLVCITQNAERVDAAVRALWEWNYVFRKVNFFGNAVKKKYIQYSYPGEDAHGMPLTKEVKTYNPKIYYCYKSYANDDIEEMNIKQHVNILKHPVFYAIPVVLCLTLYLVFFKSSFATGDLFGNEKVIQAYKDKQKGTTAKTAPPALTAESTSLHAPTIYRHEDKSGRITFSNRVQNYEKNNG